jgi:ATP-dependent DNA ligase
MGSGRPREQSLGSAVQSVSCNLASINDTVSVTNHLRHLEDMTEKYPDICHLILSMLTRPIIEPVNFPASSSTPSKTALDLLHVKDIRSFIMDAEVVAVDKDTGAYRTFQELTNRAKKDVKIEDIKVVVGVFAFDLMLLNDTVSPHGFYAQQLSDKVYAN